MPKWRISATDGSTRIVCSQTDLTRAITELEGEGKQISSINIMGEPEELQKILRPERLEL